jgi:hypothetical protein
VYRQVIIFLFSVDQNNSVAEKKKEKEKRARAVEVKRK